MSAVRSALFLRRALLVDAVASFASALPMLLATSLLAGWLSLPEPLLFEVGLLLLPWVALVGWLASRREPPAGAVRAVIVLNVLYAAGCVFLLASGAVAPNALGVGFVLMQAAAVLVFAQLQWIGLRRQLAH